MKRKATIKFEQYLSQHLFLYGFKKNRDYTLSKQQLYIKNSDVKSKLISALKELFPEKHYYWETPRLLRWF